MQFPRKASAVEAKTGESVGNSMSSKRSVTALGQKILALAKARALSLDALAERAGLDRRTVRSAIYGDHNPVPQTLRFIAEALAVEPALLLDIDMVGPAPGVTERLPPPTNDQRGTPRMLSRLLAVIRLSPPPTGLASTAATMGFTTVDELDRLEYPPPEFDITYKDLERFQDLDGFPVGVLLVIAHMAAMVRDNKEDEVKLIARMLQALSGRILDPHPSRDDIMRVATRKGDRAHTYDDWDRILSELLNAICSAMPRNEREPLMNHKRLERYRKEQLKTHS